MWVLNAPWEVRASVTPGTWWQLQGRRRPPATQAQGPFVLNNVYFLQGLALKILLLLLRCLSLSTSPRSLPSPLHRLTVCSNLEAVLIAFIQSGNIIFTIRIQVKHSWLFGVSLVCWRLSLVDQQYFQGTNSGGSKLPLSGILRRKLGLLKVLLVS